jgi:RNA polymerase sigma-70 factor (ECF subfamily)
LSPARKSPEIPSSAQDGAETDEELMARFCQGDSRAFDVLFARYHRAVHAYLFRMLGNRAASEDLTQATFLSLVRARGRFIPGNRVRPWIYAIATNAARDSLRRRKPEELTPEGELPQDASSDSPGPRDAGLERRVHQALSMLPEAQREAIMMHRFEGLSFGEIAEALGLTESAVKVRAHRGYERLRELLQDLKEDAR